MLHYSISRFKGQLAAGASDTYQYFQVCLHKWLKSSYMDHDQTEEGAIKAAKKAVKDFD